MVHKIVLTSETNYKFKSGGFPKPPPGLIIHLEGLTELTESCYIHSYGLLLGKDTIRMC